MPDNLTRAGGSGASRTRVPVLVVVHGVQVNRGDAERCAQFAGQVRLAAAAAADDGDPVPGVRRYRLALPGRRRNAPFDDAPGPRLVPAPVPYRGVLPARTRAWRAS